MTEKNKMIRCKECDKEFPEDEQVFMGVTYYLGTDKTPEQNAGGFCSKECGDRRIDWCLYGIR